ncbi:hypothetical protein COV18_06220 [Candidatus Woesearchaeota archaeon CG10_big_fil_rev_8_21_14_0_10_37_12]|nr:MAG: hypothetical protein COV18_06220 [Candidatus Woesearchaeota archaeon CG10_big_fil_rev_8_21_14_0_10_37_12]
MILIISTCKERLSELEYVLPVQKLIKHECKIVHCTNLNKRDIPSANKIIITGTALKDFDYFATDWSWLKVTNVPVLGLCAGMQVILREFDVELSNISLIGPHKVEIVKENKLVRDDFTAYFLTTKVGFGLEALAQVDDIPVLFKHPKKKLYGCLFHPEVLNENIIENFLKL